MTDHTDHEQDEPRGQSWPERTRDELDRAIRAALADPPTEDERAAAATLEAAFRVALAIDPVRLAAAVFGPPAAALALKDQAENARDDDLRRAEESLAAVAWVRSWAQAVHRLADARATDAMAAAPDAWATSGHLPPMDAFTPHEPRRDLLTPTQAAERLGVSVAELRRLSERGELSTVRLPNGRRRYAPGAIDAARERLADTS